MNFLKSADLLIRFPMLVIDGNRQSSGNKEGKVVHRTLPLNMPDRLDFLNFLLIAAKAARPGAKRSEEAGTGTGFSVMVSCVADPFSRPPQSRRG